MNYSSKDVFENLARDNERANLEMSAVLAILTDRARRRESGSWFGSILGILNHIIICDLHWLKRFQALSPHSAVLTDRKLDPPNLSWHHDLHEEFEPLRAERLVADGSIRAWFAEFPEERYGESFQYTDSSGTSRKTIAGSAFQFFFLHQVHHRGAVAQILDGIGLPNNFMNNLTFLDQAE
jgi:uncharacterized damage-inducible protein DinB